MEVEVIGLPVDCNKEQTRVVDDNGEAPGATGEGRAGAPLVRAQSPGSPGPGRQPPKEARAQVASGLGLGWEVTPPPGGL